MLYGVYPGALGRFLLYFFYRWETCVREATVLGMLGIVSLGRLITDSRVRMREDEMLFYVLLGASLVLILGLSRSRKSLTEITQVSLSSD